MFKVLSKGKIEFADPLAEGQVSIGKGGQARFRTEDLAKVSIDGACVILTDEMSMRIALRKPKPSETREAYRVSAPRTGKAKVDDSRRIVSLGHALKELRLDPDGVSGRYAITYKEDLAIITMTEMSPLSDGKDDDDEE